MSLALWRQEPVSSVDLDLPALKSQEPGSRRRGQRHQRAESRLSQRHGQNRRQRNIDVDVNTSRELIDDLNDLPIKVVDGAVIYISDVAQVRDGYTPQQNIVRHDGVRGTLLTIIKSGAPRPSTWSSGVKAALPAC